MPTYGFRYNSPSEGYEIDEKTMPVVRRIFGMIAEGNAVNAVKRAQRDAEAVLMEYAGHVPKALESMTSEERQHSTGCCTRRCSSIPEKA